MKDVVAKNVVDKDVVDKDVVAKNVVAKENTSYKKIEKYIIYNYLVYIIVLTIIIMSNFAKAFASFLAHTYYPVSVSFKSGPIMYSNHIFSVSHRNKSSVIDSDNNCENGYITFDLALNKFPRRYIITNKLNTAESFIKYMLDKPTSNTTFELTKNNNNCIFNTNGNIPLRYIDMINDFSYYKFKYNTPSQLDIKLYETQLYEEKIAFINNNILLDIYNYSKYLTETDRILKINVTKSPSYPFDSDFLKEHNYGICDVETQKSLKNRVWSSSDGDFSSLPTKIFFNRSHKLKSLNNIGYHILFSSSGGIDFSYVKSLPWFQLKQQMGDQQNVYDISGTNTYYSQSDNIGTTEFIILAEALAKEGAEYTVEFC